RSSAARSSRLSAARRRGRWWRGRSSRRCRSWESSIAGHPTLCTWLHSGKASVKPVTSRVELLREVVPGLRRVAVMANVGYAGAVQEMGEAQAAARMFGLEVVTLEIQRAEDIAPGFEALKGHAEALYVCAEALVTANRVRISTLANVARLPTMHGQREHV